MNYELGLCLLLLATTYTASFALELGSLPNLQHGVSGTLHVDDDVTIRIENFHYDGLGPTVFLYYYGHGANVNSNGDGGITIPVPASIGGQSDGRFAPGRSFNGEQVVFKMPSGTTVRDIGTLTIWCRQFSAFFTRITFPANIVIPGGGGGGGGGGDNNKPKNCVPLSNQLQLSWSINTTVAKPMATFTLCGCLLTDGYMSFGLSGNADSVNMVNGDVTVAWIDTQAHAEDYYLQRREQCRAGIGVCPDKVSTAGSTCEEDNFDVSGSVNNGVTCVTYSRYLNTSDTDCDTVFDMSRLQSTYIIWALGPRGTTAFQHFSRSGVPLNLTRNVTDECTTAPTCTNCEGFSPNTITAMTGTTFTAEIGASGGPQGYQNITGQPGWGITWYINGQLVPELTLRRGQNYTFRVFGGNNASIANRASYHPFYITDSSSGGRLLDTAEQRRRETVFAGFDDNDQPTGVGTLCEFNEGSGSEAIRQQCGKIEQYMDSLTKSCKQNPPVPAEVVFSPNDTTPNVVYYQCATHINLGWRINVVPTIAAGSVLIQSWIVILVALAGVLLFG